jgi:drug/metabolite transporter (DMT)-like permease
MIYLILSILASTFIFVLFKLFPKYGVNTFQAIVFNYFTAFSCGFLLYGSELKNEAFQHLHWLPYAVLCGILFISLFFLMGISSQKNGVAMTSISVKMSMALSVLLLIIWYKESLGFMKLGGIIAAISGVVFISFPSKSERGKTIIWMLFVLFIGSGVLDFVLNYVKENELTHLPASLFSAIGFGIAGTIGVIILIFQLATKKTKFSYKNILAGIILGIPNYFSIFFLILSYSTTGLKDSSVLAITNVCIVLNAAIIGFIVFKENFSLLKLVGMILSISAILLLFFSEN